MPRGEVAQGVDQSEAWRPQVFFGAVLLARVLGVVDHEIGVGHEFGVPAVPSCRMDSIWPGSAPARQSSSENGSWSTRYTTATPSASTSVAHRHGRGRVFDAAKSL